MNQEIEIEFKNLLTKAEFEFITNSFHLLQSDFFAQENHYFDTVNFSLMENGCALRIRKKESRYTLTLKQPHEEGLLETHQQLTEELALSLLQNDRTLQTIEGRILDIISAFSIDPNDIEYLGTLKTDRAELEHEGNLLVLDHSYYLGHEDYELEYEVKDAIKGIQRFSQLLDEYDIIKRPTDNKISRFFKLKERQQMRS